MTLRRLRIGIGHDTHRLAPGGRCGWAASTIPHDRRLVGHSDADVLLHAVTDALLGAAAWATSASCFPTPTRRTAAATRPRCCAGPASACAQAGYRDREPRLHRLRPAAQAVAVQGRHPPPDRRAAAASTPTASA